MAKINHDKCNFANYLISPTSNDAELHDNYSDVDETEQKRINQRLSREIRQQRSWALCDEIRVLILGVWLQLLSGGTQKGLNPNRRDATANVRVYISDREYFVPDLAVKGCPRHRVARII